jgi:hypothetical protein
MFAGPTLARARAIAPDLDLSSIIVLPPIRRGDITRIVGRQREPGALAIVDGFFHLANLSVGHFEIRLAMKKGWSVWGLSSMGAIRAAEMHHMGVHGWGEVFRRYRDDPEFRDDEVALLHEPTPPYREASEPLVHIRTGIDALVRRGTIDAGDASHVVEHLMTLWFGERSLAYVRDLLAERRPACVEELRAWIQDFDPYRIKAHDLIDFVRHRRWLAPAV